MSGAAFIYSPFAAQYSMGESHPLRPVRVQLTYELLEAYGAFKLPGSQLVKPEPASEADILTFHDPAYVEAVKKISRGEYVPDAHRYNIAEGGDNPPYEFMYEVSSLAAGAGLKGAKMLLDGEVDTAFNVIGGYHHAARNHASGFCVFNDLVIALLWLLKQGKRPLYIDIDCHHGDGVQHAFETTGHLMTISLHESGHYLFPGTGMVEEFGKGPGMAWAVNVPLHPHTDDETYLWAFREVVPPLVKAVKPDVLVTQLGCDTHYLDPLTHLQLTTAGYTQVIRELKALSPGKWLAFGGGGYEISVVARAWALAYGVMLDQDWPDQIPTSFSDKYGLKQLRDHKQPFIDRTDKTAAWEQARKAVDQVKRLIFPPHRLKS
jgi:acetoin utilization protein AcuC